MTMADGSVEKGLQAISQAHYSLMIPGVIHVLGVFQHPHSHLLRIRKEEIEGAWQLMARATYYGLLTIYY